MVPVAERLAHFPFDSYMKGSSRPNKKNNSKL